MNIFGFSRTESNASCSPTPNKVNWTMFSAIFEIIRFGFPWEPHDESDEKRFGWAHEILLMGDRHVDIELLEWAQRWAIKVFYVRIENSNFETRCRAAFAIHSTHRISFERRLHSSPGTSIHHQVMHCFLKRKFCLVTDSIFFLFTWASIQWRKFLNVFVHLWWHFQLKSFSIYFKV